MGLSLTRLLQEHGHEVVLVEKDPARMEKHLERLNSIESQVSQISVPLAYREEVYNLRLHIDLLRKKLRDVNKSEVESR